MSDSPLVAPVAGAASTENSEESCANASCCSVGGGGWDVRSGESRLLLRGGGSPGLGDTKSVSPASDREASVEAGGGNLASRAVRRSSVACWTAARLSSVELKSGVGLTAVTSTKSSPIAGTGEPSGAETGECASTSSRDGKGSSPVMGANSGGEASVNWSNDEAAGGGGERRRAERTLAPLRVLHTSNWSSVQSTQCEQVPFDPFLLESPVLGQDLCP